jgi:integrase
MKLTRAAVEALALPAGKPDHIIWDDTLPGFGVRLRAGKTVRRTYIVQYRVGHQQRRQNLGDVRAVDLDAARRVARRRLGSVALGHDPAAERAEARRRARLTLGSFVERFLERKRATLRPGTFRAVQRHLRRRWAPLHDRPVHEVVRRDVAALLAEIQEQHGVNAAREARNVLGEMFAWLMGEGIADSNPVIGTNAPPPPGSRDRVLNDAELAAIWHAAEGVGGDYGMIVRLLIVVPCRREEIGDLRWGEIEGGSQLRIPGRRTKNGRELVLPMPPIAMAVLAEAQACRLNHDRRVFGKRVGGFSGWAHGKALLDASLTAAGLQPWRMHDVRRSVATRMADIGVQPHVIEQILNHVSGHKGGVAGTYNRSTYDREVRAAMMLWGEHVEAFVEGRDRKVIHLAQRPA